MRIVNVFAAGSIVRGDVLLMLIAAVLSACGVSSEPLPPSSSGSAPTMPDGGVEGAAPGAFESPDAGTPVAPIPETPKTPNKTANECFADLTGTAPRPDYDQFGPTVLPSCSGTRHQSIAGVERVVFLGDSITEGSFPTSSDKFYRTRLEATLKQKFGAGIETSNCAKWGARNRDLLEGGKQLEKCFPGGVEPKKTLVIMTTGGNDVGTWAKDKIDAPAAMAAAAASVAQLRSAIEWLKSPVHFPNGSFVVFSNVYEYTDTSGDLSSCPAAVLSGFTGAWPEGKAVLVHLAEGYMKIAVDTKSDLLFMLEHFCGRGYKREDASLQCYRGPNAPLWFDPTCYHPNDAGHEQIALEFAKVIDGG